MKKLIVLSFLFVVLLLPTFAGRKGNQPCSGKKGGIARCSKGKFISKDGAISKSKRICRS